MATKIVSFFILLLSFAVYDKYGTIEWNTNFVVLYYVVFYGFVVFWIWETYKSARNKLDRSILIVLSLPFVLRIFLNLLAVGRDRDIYNSLVSNQYIDLLTWVTLMVFLTMILWGKYIR